MPTLRQITMPNGTTQTVDLDTFDNEALHYLMLDQTKIKALAGAGNPSAAGQPPKINMQEAMTPKVIGRDMGTTYTPTQFGSPTMNIDRASDRAYGASTGVATGAINGPQGAAMGGVMGAMFPPRDTGDVAENAFGNAALGGASRLTGMIPNPLARGIAGGAAGLASSFPEKAMGNLFRQEPESVDPLSMMLRGGVPVAGGVAEQLGSGSRFGAARPVVNQVQAKIGGTPTDLRKLSPREEIKPALDSIQNTDNKLTLAAQLATRDQLAKQKANDLSLNSLKNKRAEWIESTSKIKEAGQRETAREVISIDKEMSQIRREMEKTTHEGRVDRAAKMLDLDEKIAATSRDPGHSPNLLAELQSQKRQLQAGIDPLDPKVHALDALEAQRFDLTKKGGSDKARAAIVTARQNRRIVDAAIRDQDTEKIHIKNELDRITTNFSDIEAAVPSEIKKIRGLNYDQFLDQLFGPQSKLATADIEKLMAPTSSITEGAKTAIKRAGIQQWFKAVTGSDPAAVEPFKQKMTALLGPNDGAVATRVMDGLGTLHRNPVIQSIINASPWKLTTAIGTGLAAANTGMAYFPAYSVAIGTASGVALTGVLVSNLVEKAIRSPKFGVQFHRWLTDGKMSAGSLKYFPALDDFLKKEGQTIKAPPQQ